MILSLNEWINESENDYIFSEDRKDELVNKYESWAGEQYTEPSDASVLEFLQNNMEDYANEKNVKMILNWLQ